MLAVTTVTLLIILFIPALRSIVFFGPPHRNDLLLCAVAGVIAFTALEFSKWVGG